MSVMIGIHDEGDVSIAIVVDSKVSFSPKLTKAIYECAAVIVEHCLTHN